MTEEEERILAWTLLGEAGGEGSRGMTAVANVIRNRALSGRFPNNPASVALQSNSRGIHQFSTWNPISEGGNIPRARYPAGSTEFGEAMRIVGQVFGATPGADPTRGATHYYAPQGMAGGNAPYWWDSEAPNGSTRIGNHVFAVKYDTKEAPVPASRKGGAKDPVGGFPSKNALEVFRTGQPIRLPDIPINMSLGEGLAIRSVKTYVVDPVTGRPQPVVSASDKVRAVSGTGQRQPSKTVQTVAGFSVPQGVEGIRKVDAVRQNTAPAKAVVSASDKVRAAQKQFAAPAQPNGSISLTKDQARLAPGQLPQPVMSASDMVRGRKPVPAKVVVPAPVPVPQPAPRIAPVPTPRVQAKPVPQAKERLAVVVSGAQTISVPKAIVASNGYVYEGGKQVGTVRPVGMTAAEQYSIVNAAAAARARESAGKSGSKSYSERLRDNESASGPRESQGVEPSGSIW